MSDFSIEDMAVQDFAHAALLLLITRMLNNRALTEEDVLAGLASIRDKLQDPESDVRLLLGNRIPKGVETPYWSAVGSAYDRHVALFQTTMAML